MDTETEKGRKGALALLADMREACLFAQEYVWSFYHR